MLALKQRKLKLFKIEKKSIIKHFIGEKYN